MFIFCHRTVDGSPAKQLVACIQRHQSQNPTNAHRCECGENNDVLYLPSRWCSHLCPEMHCSLASPGIVELLPALDHYQCAPKLAEQYFGLALWQPCLDLMIMKYDEIWTCHDMPGVCQFQLFCASLMLHWFSVGLVKIATAWPLQMLQSCSVPRLTACAAYVKTAWSNKQVTASFWHFIAMLFLLLPLNDVKEVQETGKWSNMVKYNKKGAKP